MSAKHAPTAEQSNFIELFNEGANLLGNAYAGTGKTSTSVMMAESTNRSGVYVAFNKSIAVDAASKFPANVSCSTAHSLAYRSIIRQGFSNDKMGAKVNGGVLAQLMNIGGMTLAKKDGSTAVLGPRAVGTLVADTILNWQRSAARMIAHVHIPRNSGVLTQLDDDSHDKLETFVFRAANMAWEKMRDPNNTAWPLGHDGYLKLWAMDRPQLAAPGTDAFSGFVMLDEAQDTNGVLLQVMRDQECQVIAVGDRHQQIYGWRGAINAMTALRGEGVNEARLTTSWRFGESVAGYATSLLELLGETHPLQGNPANTDTVFLDDDAESPRPDCILARTNARLIQTLFAEIEAGRRPFIVGGTAELLTYIRGAERLMQDQSVDTPMDFFGFKNWAEVVAASEEPEGAELRRWVNLIDGYGAERLRNTLSTLPRSERDADIIISTGHKAKGREWDNVVLADDFLRGAEASENDTPIDFSDELRLYYVAATRARKTLRVPSALTAKLDVVRDRHKPLED